jgi:glycosyltransferase involved in cell wall biosynthesis
MTHVCLLASEYFGLGTYGGFAAVTRTLAEALVEQNLRISVLLPKRKGQAATYEMNGVQIYTYSPWSVLSAAKYKDINADIFHSIEPTMATFAAQQAQPRKQHVASFLNPYSAKDWRTSFFNDDRPLLRRAFGHVLQWIFFASPPVKIATRRCDRICCHAEFLEKKARAIFHLSAAPQFIPTFVEIPEAEPLKNAQPTVAFVGRFDAIKRPEIFFELAREFPNIQFVAAGSAKSPDDDALLRKKYSDIPNLQFLGFVNQFESSALFKMLDQSWIVMNSSAKEGLPGVFLEAAAHKCALLSCNEADGFVERGGYFVQDSDFAKGLRFLLEKNRWKELADRNFAYVKARHSKNVVVPQFLSLYAGVLGK